MQEAEACADATSIWWVAETPGERWAQLGADRRSQKGALAVRAARGQGGIRSRHGCCVAAAGGDAAANAGFTGELGTGDLFQGRGHCVPVLVLLRARGQGGLGKET